MKMTPTNFHAPGVPIGPNRPKSIKITGFTLVELLVVIAIIGVLIGMLLPAVNAARESARRLQCTNHLRQIGLAFHLHSSAHNGFPSGGWNWSDAPTYIHDRPATGAQQKAGWGFQILPYLEAQNVVDQGPIRAVGYADTMFFCPTRRPPQTFVTRDNYNPPLTGTMIRRAMSDYAMSNREGTGVMKRYAPLRLAQIKDGLSKTLLGGEKRLNLRFLGQPQNDDNEGFTVGWNVDTLRQTNRVPKPDFRGGVNRDGDKRFGGSHPGVCITVFCDGACLPISFDVDPDVFESMGVRDDGPSVYASLSRQ